MSPRSTEPPTALERGRDSFDRQAWADAHALLSEADRDEPVGLEDLERLAIAANLVGRYGESAAFSVRSYQDSMRAGDVGRAARSAFWIAIGHLAIGELAPAAGWLAKAERLVGAEDRERVEAGYILVAAAVRSLAEGEPAIAQATYEQAAEIGARFSDPDLVVLARVGVGEALIALHQTARGIGLMDEAMASVTAGEVSPVVAGIVYCTVIASCQQVFDLRRAQEWTSALDRWCASQPQLVAFRGQCLLNRAVLMQFHGAWQDAAAEALRASERLAEPANPSLGDAVYQTAELHRLRGELVEAEDGYRRADQLGRRPEPGLALLRLAQGRTDIAAAAIRGAIDEAWNIFDRPRLLEPMVDIMLAAGSTTGARAAADELSQVAKEIGGPLLAAMAARSNGAVLLAEGNARASLGALRQAWTAWHSLDAPYEAACVRVLIGRACRELGDVDTAAMELDAARDVFHQLGAAPDLARLDALLDAPAPASAEGLTAREVEVLRLVAAGKTNRAVATDLVISEKTVARHLSNIFDKLGVSSRAAATAYAYEHGLIGRST